MKNAIKWSQDLRILGQMANARNWMESSAVFLELGPALIIHACAILDPGCTRTQGQSTLGEEL